MRNRTINFVVILGVLSLVTILSVQILWMQKTIGIQETNIAIQAKSDSLNVKAFTQQVEIALKKVLKQINLNGGILSTSTDGNNNLLWNGKKLLTEP